MYIPLLFYYIFVHKYFGFCPGQEQIFSNQSYWLKNLLVFIYVYNTLMLHIYLFNSFIVS
jgi:hypothetical protein